MICCKRRDNANTYNIKRQVLYFAVGALECPVHGYRVALSSCYCCGCWSWASRRQPEYEPLRGEKCAAVCVGLCVCVRVENAALVLGAGWMMMQVSSCVVGVRVVDSYCEVW